MQVSTPQWSMRPGPARETQSDHLSSIVAVHGLYGHALKTWTSKGSTVPWLGDNDMLPKALPNARILTWGYNADVHSFMGSTSADTILEHAHTLVAQLQADREVWLVLVPGTISIRFIFSLNQQETSS